jgi:hypothetical protein
VKPLAPLLALALSIALPYPASAKPGDVRVVIIRVQGAAAPKLRTGATLGWKDEILLPAGTRLTLLDVSGTWVLAGPGKFSLTEALDGTPVVMDLARGRQVRKIVRLAGARASR